MNHFSEKVLFIWSVADLLRVLRHTFAALALQKGLSLAAVKKILDHDRLATTEIYLNLTDRHIQEEYDAKW